MQLTRVHSLALHVVAQALEGMISEFKAGVISMWNISGDQKNNNKIVINV